MKTIGSITFLFDVNRLLRNYQGELESHIIHTLNTNFVTSSDIVNLVPVPWERQDNINTNCYYIINVYSQKRFYNRAETAFHTEVYRMALHFLESFQIK